MERCLCKSNIHISLVVMIIIRFHYGAPFQITVSDACVERCSSRILWKWNSWCSNNCLFQTAKSSPHLLIPYITRRRKIQLVYANSKIESSPDWEKVTSDPGTFNTKSGNTQQNTVTLPTVTRQQSTNHSKTRQTLMSTKVTETHVIDSTTRKQTFIYPDVDAKNKHLQRVIEDKISIRNTHILVGSLVGLCLVVFVGFIVLHSMKKPNRVSFTENPVVVVHTSVHR